MTFGRINLDWSDKPVLIIGTGPSLVGVDLSRLKGLGHVLAVKESVWDLPFADACFGLDLPWMRRQGDRLGQLTMPLYLAIPDQHPPVRRYTPSAIYLRRLRLGNGLSTNLEEIECGGNSGFGAFNLAFLTSPRQIYLFGFDYTGSAYCPERYTHHPKHHNARYLPKWGENFRGTIPQIEAAGISVVNASIMSTVDAFPKSTPVAALEHLDRLRQSRQSTCSLRSGSVVNAASPHGTHSCA